MTEQAIVSRLDRIESRLEIRELITDYCITVDDRDMEHLRTLFTDDVCFSSPSVAMAADGVDQAIDMFNEILGIRGPGYHWTHDVMIKLDGQNPDEATGLVLAHAETTPNGVPSIAAIRYEDKYRRVEGKWKFAARTLKFLYYMPMEKFIERFPTKQRVGVSGDWIEGDFPEKLKSWQDWHKAHPGE
jgi:ketosteroid isomerase-like protein